MVNLAGAIRAAVVGEPAITARLAAYEGSYPVFTRRPAPAAAPYPIVMISPDVASYDQDGIDDQRPVVERDVAVYGQNDVGPQYGDVEAIAYAVRDLFHRQRHAITVAGWGVIDIVARGPIPAPTDDEQTVGRIVPLTIRLARQP